MKTKEERLAYIKKWREDNPDKVKEYRKRTRIKFKDKIREKNRERYPKIKEAHNLKRRIRRLNNPEFRERHKKYIDYWEDRIVNNLKETPFESYRRTYLANREKRLEVMHQRNKNRRLEIIYWYSNGAMCCSECGEITIQFLSIDHINNDGGKEKKIYKGNIINHIIRNNFPDKYQILCHNCNTIKHMKTLTRKNPSAPYHKYRDKAKREMLSLYSDGTMNCACCGFADIRALTFNHINGNGRVEFEKNGPNSIALYRLGYKRDDINVLCMNCNKSLGHYGKCPHSPQ